MHNEPMEIIFHQNNGSTVQRVNRENESFLEWCIISFDQISCFRGHLYKMVHTFLKRLIAMTPATFDITNTNFCVILW